MATELELAHVTPMDKAREYLGLSWDEFCDYVDQGEVTPYLLRRKDGNRRLFVRFFGHKGGWPNPGYFKYDCGTYGTVFFDCDELRKFLDTFATQKDEEEAFTCPEQAGMTPPTVQGAVSTYAGNYGGYYYGAMQEYTGYQPGQAPWPAYTATQRPQPMTQAPMAPKPPTPLQSPDPLPPTHSPAPLPSPNGGHSEELDQALARVAELEEELARAKEEIERLEDENQGLRQQLAEKDKAQGVDETKNKFDVEPIGKNKGSLLTVIDALRSAVTIKDRDLASWLEKKIADLGYDSPKAQAIRGIMNDVEECRKEKSRPSQKR